HGRGRGDPAWLHGSHTGHRQLPGPRVLCALWLGGVWPHRHRAGSRTDLYAQSAQRGGSLMQSISMQTEEMDWMPGSPFYGPGAIYEGREMVQLKVLSDRRAEGGGIAWLVRMTPPEGKVIRIVAVALSDEHIFSLEGGRSTKSGERLRAKGDYGLNPKGKPHS